MTSRHATAPAAPRRAAPRFPTAARRFGYLVAIAVNGVMLWVTHRLLDWEWPGFLTVDFEALLPLLTASFVAGMVVNAAFVVHDRGRFRGLADVVTSAIGLVVAIRTWNVFPFDFAGHDTDWSWLVRFVLVVAIIGTAIGVLAGLAKLVRGEEPTG